MNWNLGKNCRKMDFKLQVRGGETSGAAQGKVLVVSTWPPKWLTRRERGKATAEPPRAPLPHLRAAGGGKSSSSRGLQGTFLGKTGKLKGKVMEGPEPALGCAEA